MLQLKELKLNQLTKNLKNRKASKLEDSMNLLFQVMIHSQLSPLKDLPQDITKELDTDVMKLMLNFVEFDDKGGDKATNCWIAKPDALQAKSILIEQVEELIHEKIELQGYNKILDVASTTGTAFAFFSTFIQLFLIAKEEQKKLELAEVKEEVTKAEQLEKATNRIIPTNKKSLAKMKATLINMDVKRLIELKRLIASAEISREDKGMLPLEDLRKELNKTVNELAEKRKEVQDFTARTEVLQSTAKGLKAELKDCEDPFKIGELQGKLLAHESGINKLLKKIDFLTEVKIVDLEKQRLQITDQMEEVNRIVPKQPNVNLTALDGKQTEETTKETTKETEKAS